MTGRHEDLVVCIGFTILAAAMTYAWYIAVPGTIWASVLFWVAIAFGIVVVVFLYNAIMG